ncbi:high mobility group protein HMGI-C isoform X1 [Chiloscyllium plagiosum]|uniref:high mobility group protein HMGI-C isoform X1 n=1 Tax=Chiloscyllium plagiosum TaxID=36176 RepID=UPI001CB88306|nr:high mobility group protein HMGI-C isoform X1 [Chiloscyllium plagiosum]
MSTGGEGPSQSSTPPEQPAETPQKRGRGRPKKQQQVSIMRLFRFRNRLDHLRLNDRGEDQKEAKTRVPPKQLKRKLSPLVRNDLGVDLENGNIKRYRRSMLRKRVKERPRKNPQRKIKNPHYFTSTSFSSWVF